MVYCSCILTESETDCVASVGDGLPESAESHGHHSCFFCHKVNSLIRSNIVGPLELCEALNNSKNDSVDEIVLGRANPKPE